MAAFLVIVMSSWFSELFNLFDTCIDGLVSLDYLFYTFFGILIVSFFSRLMKSILKGYY